MNKIQKNSAKTASVVAGLALVMLSFGGSANAQTASVAAQIAALQAQIAALMAGNTVAMTFTRDLTIGATGADVTQLQTWLMGKGYSIPAGPTGYFGVQTRAAVASFQAGNGIVPAAGYFGPITRARVNAMIGSTSGGGSTGGTTGGTLSGGEADLRDYDLRSGDDLREGDSDQEIALARFDVEGGDVRIERVTIEMTPQSSGDNQHPWEFIDSLSVYDGSKKIGDIDAGSKSDWDDQDDDSDHSGSLDYYSIDIPVSDIVREGDTVELSIRADAQNTIDSSDMGQTFDIDIPDNGIRAVDAAGIQQYTGDTNDVVTLGFDTAESGDLTIRASSDNPNAGVLVADDTTTSDEFDVLRFEIKNSDNADATLNSVMVTVATSSPSGSPASDITDIIRRATLTIDGEDFDGDVKANNTIDFDDLDVTIDGDDTTDAVLTIELFGQSGHFAASGETLRFSIASGDVDAEGSDSGDTSDVSGSVNGKTMSISTNGGVNVDGNSATSVLTYNSNTPSASFGTFTLKFDVTANGDDVYIPKTIALDSASSTYAGVHVVNTGNSFSGSDTATLTTTADSQNSNFYVVREGDTETFTASVTLNPSSDGTYQIGLDFVQFSTTDANLNNLQRLEIDENDSDFQTNPLFVPNS